MLSPILLYVVIKVAGLVSGLVAVFKKRISCSSVDYRYFVSDMEG